MMSMEANKATRRGIYYEIIVGGHLDLTNESVAADFVNHTAVRDDEDVGWLPMPAAQGERAAAVTGPT